MHKKPDLLVLVTVTFALLLSGGCAGANESNKEPLSLVPSDSIDEDLLPDIASVITFDSTAAYLQTFVREETGIKDASNEAVQLGLQRFYEKGQFKPVWLEGLKLTDHAIALITDVCNADEASLLPVSYQPDLLQDALNRAADAPTHRTLASLDLQLSRTFMLYADDHLAGRLDPEVLPYDVFLERDLIALDSVMEKALNRSAPKSFSAFMQPEHPHYERLIGALDRYREITNSGGWPSIMTEEVLKPGMTHGAVPALRRRLSISGDFFNPIADSSIEYDRHVAAAVARFQARHGLAVDSLVGPATRSALNVTAESRVRQIERTIERWRWLPRDLTNRYVLVNIPGFKVYGYDAGVKALEMRVIVGSEYKEQYTPVFSDRMDYVVFRPFWNVPHSIASQEIAPKAMVDSMYISRNNFEILAGEQIVTPDQEALDKLVDGIYRIRQKAGPTNALGLVKFIFPNRHAIYLHDTPADHLFESPDRDLSHGCIRLEDPPRFASYVLGGQGWTPERIHEAINMGDRQKVLLDDPIPVYLMYLTAFVDEQGMVSFYDDVYGFDEELEEILSNRRMWIRSAVGNSRIICHALERFKALG